MATRNSSRREFLRTAALGAAAYSMGGRGVSAGETGSSARPNILLFYSDDQRFNTIHALNNPEIQTPNLDRLAREGTAFTWAHTMGGLSGALCVPSRAMLMTGRTLFHLKANRDTIPAEHVTLGEYFGAQGYETFATGKWHNDRASFARSFSAGGSIFFGGMSDHLATPVYAYDPSGKYPKENARTAGVFSSTMFSDEAIGFLRARDKERPFFLYAAYTAPHDPRMAPKAFADLYPPEKISLPPNFLPEHPFDNGELHVRDEELAPFPRTPEIVRAHIAAYYAMITHLDFEIGRVLDTLDASGQAENTIVVFAGDNGLAVGQHGLLGKQSLYDHSARIPLIFRGPGVPRGEQRDALCYQLDVFPTLCGMIGAPPPASVEGHSLVPALRGERGPRETLFGAYRHCQRMIRDHEWKLILYNAGGQRHTQLFNVAKDPWEMRNLAEDPAQAERIARMTASLRESMRRCDDPCNLDKSDWNART